MRREQRRQLLVLERSELEHERRARAPDAVGKPAHALGRRELVRAVGREQQNPPVVEVVREEDDEIERRRVGPVQILEHEQHGRGGRALGEQRERLLEHPQLRARGPLIDLPKLSERAQGLDERLVGQLRADEIDRAPEEDLEPCVAGAARELGREPGLADARLSGDEDGRAAARPRRVERALELPELACASDERRSGASLHAASIPPPLKAPATRRYVRPAAKDKALRPMRPGSSHSDDRVDTDEHEEAGDDSSRTSSVTEIHTVKGGGGLRLHVREWGKPDGPPILFIHGWSQNHLCWAKQYESALADEFRLVAYDLRGHGMSEAPLEPEHYTDGKLWADDVAAIIDQLRLDRPVLVGWSYGAFVICDYVRTHGAGPDRRRSSSSRAPSSWARRRSAR